MDIPEDKLKRWRHGDLIRQALDLYNRAEAIAQQDPRYVRATQERDALLHAMSAKGGAETPPQ